MKESQDEALDILNQACVFCCDENKDSSFTEMISRAIYAKYSAS
jgi:hypothetical protein